MMSLKHILAKQPKYAFAFAKVKARLQIWESVVEPGISADSALP